MRDFLRRAWVALTPGVRSLLLVFSAAYVATILGRVSGWFDVHFWLALDPHRFSPATFWQLVSYAYVPAGLLDFAMNGLVVAWSGRLLERVWSRGELLAYSLVCSAATGLVGVLLLRDVAVVLVGATGMSFGLLAACAALSGHERAGFPGVGEIRLRTLVLVVAAMATLTMASSVGWRVTLALLSGGLGGWLYLGGRSLAARPDRTLMRRDDRARKLEL